MVYKMIVQYVVILMTVKICEILIKKKKNLAMSPPTYQNIFRSVDTTQKMFDVISYT
jgi:hypothetical protein